MFGGIYYLWSGTTSFLTELLIIGIEPKNHLGVSFFKTASEVAETTSPYLVMWSLQPP